MSVTANEVALASVLTTLVIGASTVVTTWRDRLQNKLLRGEDRAHERQLERDGEVFPFKQRAYEDILTFFESWNLWMEWTEPWFSEHSPDALKEMLPDLPAPKEQVNMLARLALFSSDEVYELAKRQTRRIQAFDRAVKTLRTMREGLKDGAEHWQKVEERRADARASHEELAAAMREELGSTAPRPVAELLPGRTTE